MEQMSDRERFASRSNFEWQRRRPVTYFWPALDDSFRRDGIRGLRRELILFLRGKCEDVGVYLEFVNCLTHLAKGVLDGRRRDLRKKGYDSLAADEKAREWPLLRSVCRVWEVAHKMFALRRSDKRAWHIKLSKLEKEWM